MNRGTMLFLHRKGWKMTDNHYLAKTDRCQTIIEHTEDLLRILDDFNNDFPEQLSNELKEMIYYACVYHDIGKVNRRFQNKLYEKLDISKIELENKKWKEIQHGYLSSVLIDYYKMVEILGEENSSIVIAAVYYHHARNGMTLEDRNQLREMLKSELEEDVDGFDYSRTEQISLDYRLKNLKKIRFVGRKGIFDEKIMKYVIVKGFLNKIDYAASSQIPDVRAEIKSYEKIGDVISNNFSNKGP